MGLIVRNIRKRYFVLSLWPLLRLIIFYLLVVAAGYSVFVVEFDLFRLIITVIFAALAVNSTVIFYKLFRIVIFPHECNVFKKYGDENEILKILSEISCTIEYEDKYIIISRNYIYNPKHIASLVACNDVLGVHKYIHKTNFVVDCVCIDITDKYGTVHRFDTYNEASCDELIRYLVYKCKNAKFGYNNAQQAYIERNKIPLIDVRENQIVETKLYCVHCGYPIKEHDRFCGKCGTRIY